VSNAQEALPEIGAFRDGAGLDATADDGGGEEAPTVAPRTTAAPGPTTTAAPADTRIEPFPPFIIWSAVELEQLPDLAAKADELLSVKSIEEVFGPPDEEAETRIGELEIDLCRTTGLAIAPTATEAFIVAISGINDVEVAIIAYISGDFDDATVLAHDLETCRVMATP
jgi:hypothetical protein